MALFHKLDNLNSGNSRISFFDNITLFYMFFFVNLLKIYLNLFFIFFFYYDFYHVFAVFSEYSVNLFWGSISQISIFVRF